MTTGQGAFVYEVVGVRHQGRPGPGRAAGRRVGRLTLVTAARGAGLGGLQAVADRVRRRRARPTARSRPARSATADLGVPLMSGGLDTTTLALLALSLQLLVLALAGFVWAWHALVAARRPGSRAAPACWPRCGWSRPSGPGCCRG